MKIVFRRSILFIIFSFLLAFTYAQQEQYAFRITFTDKLNTSFTLDNPTEYLSARAIARRVKYGIQIDSTDLPVVSGHIDSVLSLTGGVLHNQSRWQNACVILVNDSTSITALQNIAFVSQVKKVAYYPTGLHFRTSSESTTDRAQRPADFNAGFYGAAWEQIHLCSGEYLHEQGRMGENMWIAVIDVGFTGVNTATAFDSMRNGNRIIDTWNFISDTADVYHAGVHGCQVLSCMAAYIPELYVGTAPQASYALYATDDLYTEQAIEEDNFLAATERADSIGIDLINASVGYNTFDNPSDSYSYDDLDGHTTIVAKAANKAVQKGMLVVVSAGNEGMSSWKYILTPGDADSVLTVGAVDNLKVPSPSSSEGPNASGRLKPNVSAMGVLTSVVSAGGTVTQLSGTSFATPVLAGLAACLMQYYPEKDPVAIMNLIESTAHLYETPDNKSGYGVPDFRKAINPSNITNSDFVKNEVLFDLYPNPADNSIYLTYAHTNKDKANACIYNNQGQVIKNVTLHSAEEEINIKDLSPGIYFIKIGTSKWMAAGKFIKQ